MALMHFREENQVKWVGTRPGHNGTQIVSRAGSVGALVPVYTVLAGDTFYLTFACLSFNAVGAVAAHLSIYNAVPALTMELARHVSPGALNNPAVSQNYWPPIELPAGWSVQIFSNAPGVTAIGTVHGWVE